MRVVLLSDTHGLHEFVQVPEGDLLLHAGDMSKRGGLEEIERFNAWLETLPHPHKVVIAGNHDFCFELRPREARQLMTAATYLQDEAVEIEGFTIYGSPWQPRFFDWAFNLDRGEPLRQVWQRIPENTDILITHGPPHGVLDETSRGVKAGCEELAQRLAQLSVKLHLFGHIHEAYGHRHRDGTDYYNASICTLGYEPTHPPIVVDM